MAEAYESRQKEHGYNAKETEKSIKKIKISSPLLKIDTVQYVVSCKRLEVFEMRIDTKYIIVYS